MFNDFYTTTRSTALIKADPERQKQRRVALKRSRLTHVSHILSDPATQLRIFLQAARDNAVRNAIESRELTADDKENIAFVHRDSTSM